MYAQNDMNCTGFSCNVLDLMYYISCNVMLATVLLKSSISLLVPSPSHHLLFY